MNMLYIKGAHIVTPDKVIDDSSILLANGRIAAIGEACPEGAEVYDAKGGYVVPGFIDIHVHGGGDSDFMDSTVEDIHQVARAHAAHGTTGIVATTMTCPDEDLEAMIECYLEAERTQQDGAKLLGLHLEGPYFSAATKGSRGAQPITEQRVPTREKLEKVIKLAQGRILRWDAAPEIEGIDIFAQVMKENGILAAVAHTGAVAEEAEHAYDLGFRHATHFYNAMTTFHKVDGIVHSGVIEATYLNDDVTIELIGDGRHIPKQSMQLAVRIKGADNICLITDAMRAAGTNDEYSILGARKNGVPVVVKNDVAQVMDLSVYAGSVCTMDRALRVAHLRYGLPLEQVCRMLSLTPARLCGIADKTGSLETGKDADVVIMTPDFTVQDVFIKGERFQA